MGSSVSVGGLLGLGRLWISVVLAKDGPRGNSDVSRLRGVGLVESGPAHYGNAREERYSARPEPPGPIAKVPVSAKQSSSRQ
jgi:hypothetical protein